MKKTTFTSKIIYGIILLAISLSTNAQDEIDITNMISFSKTNTMNGVRLVTFIPAPVTNEYQEISALKANSGKFIDAGTNKILLYDGSFEGETLDVFESFKYKSKKVTIDFSNKSNRNISTNINPNEYLKSDGKFIDLDNAFIKEISAELWTMSTDSLEYAKNCYEFIAFRYNYIHGSWRTLAEILEAGGGECGDFTTLFVNLMRIKGIPARHNICISQDGAYHVWPDFYLNDYGWIPLDPTYKHSDPYGDYFGRYDGNLIIVSQGLTSFAGSGVGIKNSPLQVCCYWFWYQNGSGNIEAKHIVKKEYLVTGIENIQADGKKEYPIYNLWGIKQNGLTHGINIVNGKKIYFK